MQAYLALVGPGFLLGCGGSAPPGAAWKEPMPDGALGLGVMLPRAREIRLNPCL